MLLWGPREAGGKIETVCRSAGGITDRGHRYIAPRMARTLPFRGLHGSGDDAHDVIVIGVVGNGCECDHQLGKRREGDSSHETV